MSCVPLVQDREFTIEAEKEYTARMCAKLGFARRVATDVVDTGAPDSDRVKERHAEEQQQQQHNRCELDDALTRACRALLWRGSICMHDFFSALHDNLCEEWATEPQQIFQGCSFEECARSLAPKEWEVSSKMDCPSSSLGY